jgi:hypothetical protein
MTHKTAVEVFYPALNFVPLIIPRHGPRREHGSLLSQFNRCSGYMFLREAITQQRMPYIWIFHLRCLEAGVVFSHYIATGLHAIILQMTKVVPTVIKNPFIIITIEIYETGESSYPTQKPNIHVHHQLQHLLTFSSTFPCLNAGRPCIVFKAFMNLCINDVKCPFYIIISQTCAFIIYD